MASTLRTTTTAVREVIDTKLEEESILAFIRDANMWVTEQLGTTALTANRLEVIERYLACSFIRIRELGLTSTSIEDVREQYQVDPKVSEYLMRAASFDTTGQVNRTFIKLAMPVVFKVGKRFSHPKHGRRIRGQ